MSIDTANPPLHVIQNGDRPTLRGGTKPRYPCRTGDVERKHLQAVDDRPTVVRTPEGPRSVKRSTHVAHTEFIDRLGIGRIGEGTDTGHGIECDS